MNLTPCRSICGLITSVMLLPCLLIAQDKVTLSGYVKDASNGEALIGATVMVTELIDGGITDVNGFYSITIAPGTYTVEYSFTGYGTFTETIDLTTNQRRDMELGESSEALEEVVVRARAENSNVTSNEMSVARMDIKTMTKMPALFGEVDVIRNIQLLPGVSTVGEGASGFNVRGGGVGQNLVLLDQAPVYNSSHLFGFFSVFNPDAVKDVKLYKGGIPAQYGGRIASILDVRTKEGNSKELDVAGGVGLVFSRLAIEGPIKKDKASFIVAGRRSYVDVLAAPFLKSDQSLYFYDLTAKVNYNINDKHRLFLSGYFGRDVFKFDDSQGFDWGSMTGTLRWNWIMNDRLFLNVTGIYSNYDYALSFEQSAQNQFDWDSKIRTIDFKPEFTYFINTNNTLSFGADAILYDFTPATATAVSEGESVDISLEDKRSLETSVYISNRQEVNDRLALEYGLRLSRFDFLGPTNVYTYGDAPAGERRPVIGVERADKWESVADFTNLEPRFSARYTVNPTTSIKASYNRMVQYIHLLSNTVASIPLDLWTPSSNNIDPQIGDQVALGLFKNFKDNTYETSVEVFYRDTRQQIDYVDGADLLLNEFLEGEVLSGDGRAYGVELLVKKNKGRLNGWLSYTLGRTELQVDGINQNEWYPTRFDQTHNLKLAAFYDISKRVSLSSTFTLTTGTPATFPTSRYDIQGYVIPHNDNNGRNDVRIPTYHRLDLSMTVNGKEVKKDGRPRKNRDYWVFSLYNVYARENPFSIYFSTNEAPAIPGALRQTEATQFAVLGSVLPSVSYNFKF